MRALVSAKKWGLRCGGSRREALLDSILRCLAEDSAATLLEAGEGLGEGRQDVMPTGGARDEPCSEGTAPTSFHQV